MLHTSLVVVALALELVSQVPGKASSWVVVQSKEGGFSFSMPSQPQEQMMQLPSPIGNIKVKMYICRVEDSTLLVQQFALPKPVTTDITGELQTAKKTASLTLPKLISEKPIKSGDVPGIEFVNSGSMATDKRNHTVKTHIFMKGSTACNMIVVSGPDKPLPADADKFFDSIRFGGQPAAVAGMAPKAETKTAAPAPKPDPLAKRKALAKIELVDKSPEDALRTFLMATAVADEKTLRAVTLPNPDFDWLLRGEAPPFRGLEALKQEMSQKTIEHFRAGARVKLPGDEVYVIRTQDVGRDRTALRVQGSPTLFMLRRVSGHWKVDATPIIEDQMAAHDARQKSAGK